MGTGIDTVAFWDALAEEMNAHPDRFEILGDLDLDIVFLMHREGRAGDFAVRLTFEGIECTGVAEAAAGEERAAECWVEGPLAVWDAMAADIKANGGATGRHTINSLTLGNDLLLKGNEMMGIDKFSRFNQSVQEFLDGAARVGAPVAG